MTQSVTGTERQALHLSFDMGISPALNDITTYADQLFKFWEFAFWAAYQEDDERAALARHYVGAHHDMQQALRVRRMSLGSPWEVVLTTMADKAALVAYAATALIALERAFRLIMDWQRHSSDLADSALARNISERIALQAIERYESDAERFQATDAVERLLRRPILRVELRAEDVDERSASSGVLDEDGPLE